MTSPNGRAPAAGIPISGAGWVRPATGARLSRERWAGRRAALERTDRLCGLALVAADEAFLDAGQVPVPDAMPPGWDAERAALFFGTAFGCHATDEEYYRGVLHGRTPLLGASPRLFSHTLPSSPLGTVSIHYGLKGAGLVAVSGVCAGLSALSQALRALRTGSAAPALVLAAEVSSAFLQALGEDLRDGGAALLLTADAPSAALPARAGHGRVMAVAAAYRAHDPAQAARAALLQAAQGGPAPIYCTPATAELVTSDRRDLHRSDSLATIAALGPLIIDESVCPAQSGAVGALHALGQLWQTDTEQALVLTCDRHGQAAVARWAR